MTDKSGVSTQTISLPKGGGAIKGIGETFQPNLFSGTGNFTISIATSPARNDFGPKLSLQYSTGNGNGPFGLGWQLSIPRITRKTEKGLPEYKDEDVFVMSGAEDLVPVLDKENREETFQGPEDYTITLYRPRTEGLFARIEKWVRKGGEKDGDVHWQATTKENVTSIYGKTDNARIANPDNPHHIYEWLLQETFDAKGNHILYEYVKEDPDLKIAKIHEENRRYTQTYIRRILYGNVPDGLDDGKQRPKRTGTDHQHPDKPKDRTYLFEVLFDYGELPNMLPIPFDTSQPLEKENTESWPVRDDPFSSFRSGFEIRTLRRCKRVLMLHHFNEGELEGAPLVKSTDFEYANDTTTQLSLLISAKVQGYRKEGDTYRSADMPPVTFNYSEFKPEKQRYKPVTARAGDMPPVALNNGDFSLFDIFGNGLPDILQTTENGYYFWQNLGEGNLDMRHPQHTMPAGATLSNPNVAIGDMGGDGLADLIVQSPNMSGFYEATADGNWKPFKRFNTMPSFSLSDPNVRLVDLTGDGLSDVLITQDHLFLWYQCCGEKGYKGPRATARKHDLNEFPDVYFNDPSGRVRLADVSGDGLNDIVLVHNGRIDYWPNLGYGQFGKRITMANAPQFEYNFDPKRLFFVDLDGSGCSDLVYVDFDSVHFWFNQSGNGWSDKQTIHGTPYVTDMSSVQFADFFGTGTATLVWSYDYNSHPGSNYKVLDFCGGVKPYLITEMSNNMGATTKVKYASSTKFYLEDKENGNPWATNLPFPVQVLEKTEVIDHISKTKLVTSYKYHHGYFDGREREFRGFGCVEQYDTEEFETFTGSCLHEGEELFENDKKAYHVPPVCTKSWFHTGVYFDENLPSSNGSFYDKEDMMTAYREEFYHGDGKAFRLDDNEIERTEAPYEAYRALRGSVIRTEVYAIDGSVKEEHPYMVTESRYKVRKLQDAYWSKDGKKYYHGVFLPFQKEAVSYHYERNPDDPRIAHQLTLNVDEYGNITDGVSIAYPRRQPTEHDEQKDIKATYTHNRFINKDYRGDESGEVGYYYAGIPYETRLFEVHGLSWEWTPNDEGLFSPLKVPDFNPIRVPDDVPDEFEPYTFRPLDSLRSLKKRIIDWKMTYFRKDKNPESIDATESTVHRLDSGKIESLGLPYESYQAAFTTNMVEAIYGERLDISVLSGDGRYLEFEDDGYWWMPSGRQSFNPVKFFQVKQTQDPFGAKMTIEFDGYGLMMESVEDPFENKMTAVNDYRVLQPRKLTDPNQTSNEVAFDTLGMVVGTAVMGKDKDGNPVGDSLADFVEDLDENITKDHIDHPLTNPHDILKNATTRLVYDLNRFKRDGQPNVVYSMARETHALSPGSAETKIQHSFVYSDGFGREVQTKVQAEPDPLIKDNPPPRWAGTGTTIYNNKGKPVQKFEPFFSDTHTYGIEKHGVSPIIFYDPLERVVCTLHPNHTYEKVVFDPWRQETWDPNDTIHPTHRFDPQDPDSLPDPNFNPTNDHDAGQFFPELSQDMYLPTWYNLRVDQVEALKKWPDFDEHHNEIKGNANKRKAEKSAAEKAAKHAATPSVAHLDVLGRVFLTVVDNGKKDTERDDLIETHVKLDIEGNDLTITDPRKIEAFRHAFDIAGRKLIIDSVDAGLRLNLPNVAGNIIYAWDEKEHQICTVYDILQRPTHIFVKKGDVEEKVYNRMVYGEEIPNRQNAQNFNLLGKVYQQYDSAGVVINSKFDFKGNLLESSRYISKEYEYEEAPDWKDIPDISDPVEEIELVDGRIETEKFTVTTIYDALNRVKESIDPDGTHHFITYNEANLLETVHCHIPGEELPREFVSNINYNARGQREDIKYGNNIITKYEYDPETFRLQKMVSTKSNGKRVQDISYTYDPVGNITQIHDATFKTVFNGNGRIDPISRYEYDAIYRLTKARGREHEAMGSCHYQLGDKKHTEFIKFTGQPVNNGQALRNYCEDYVYDKSGNLRKINHNAVASRDCPNSGWTRDQEYSETSNRLISSTAGCDYVDTSFTHDKNGNILKMQHLESMVWDHANQLMQVEPRRSENGSIKQAHYVYDSGGQRVRNVILHNGERTEERIYLGGFEFYRKYKGTELAFERTTTHIMDDKSRIALVENRTEDPDNTETGSAIRIRYQLNNHLGSSMLEIDDLENCIGYEEYLPYGGTAFMAGDTLTEVKRKRYRYSGKERDNETGLYYYGARYYAPWLGRWINKDPITERGGLNLFIFVSNNPTNRCDPFGLQEKPTNAANNAGGETQVHTEVYNFETSESTTGFGTLITAHPLEVSLDLNTAQNSVTPDEEIAKMCFAAGESIEYSDPLPNASNEEMSSTLPLKADLAATVGGKLDELGKTRAAYGEAARDVTRQGTNKVNQGIATAEKAADMAVEQRRTIEAAAREKTPGAIRKMMEARNEVRYGDPLGPKSASELRAAGKTNEKIIESAGKTNKVVDTLGKGARIIGKATQVVGTVMMATEDSPAVTGKSPSTVLDPHISDYMNREEDYFIGMLLYWVGLRETKPELPPHMRYNPSK